MQREWISQGPSPEGLHGVYVFTQPANNSVQGPRPHSIHHTHHQVEGDEMSLSIATHFGGLNESHSPRSSKAHGLCWAASTQIPAGKERLNLTLSHPRPTSSPPVQPDSPFFNCPKAERLQSVTALSRGPARRLGLYIQGCAQSPVLCGGMRLCLCGLSYSICCTQQVLAAGNLRSLDPACATKYVVCRTKAGREQVASNV